MWNTESWRSLGIKQCASVSTEKRTQSSEYLLVPVESADINPQGENLERGTALIYLRSALAEE